MTDSIEYGTTTICYSLDYVARKTLGIAVHPDGVVEVKAPRETPLEQIRMGVLHKASWILKQQDYFSEFGLRMPARRYVSGESHLYLGRQYMLRITEGVQNRVLYHSNILEVECKRKSKAKEILKAWYKERAAIKMTAYAQPLVERFKVYGVTPSSIELREMKSRWGSCTKNGKIILNSELIHTSRICIEYVIIHELCHLVYKNHTRAFYALLEYEMPLWKKWKMKLEKQMMYSF